MLVVEAAGTEPVLGAWERGRRLLEQAPPGVPCIDAAALDRCSIGWVSADEPREAKGAGAVAALHWAGPGRRPDAPPITAPLPTESMLGREGELIELARRWRSSCEGGHSTVLVAGEPGSGKTRLASEAAVEIARAGGQVLFGVADEAETRPYAPFLSALGRASPVDVGDSPSFANLVLGASAASARLPSAAVAAERSAAFNAAINELEHRCRAAPAALVIEDLHQCGLSSLQLLGHLARSPDLSRLLILGTYRPTDLAPDSPEARLIAELAGQAGVGHIDLGPLEIRSLRGLGAAFGLERPRLERAAEVALEETGGLPLYASELLRSMAADGKAEPGAGLPRSLQVLIASRVHALGTETHRHLETAAVAGVSFDSGVVASAAGVEPAVLADSLRSAERAGLLSSDGTSGEYAFGHALTRRCLYEELDAPTRGELHRRTAIAMEAAAEAGASVQPGEIAHHWERAEPGDEQRAGKWALRAAEQALASFDPGAAVRWYERALELDERRRPPDQARRCDLLLGLGAALRLDGRARFREVLLEAAHQAVELDDPTRLASATLTNTRGFVSAIGEFDRERLAMLELAAERVEDGSLRPLVLAELALELTFAPERERRHELAEEALRLARETEEPELLARVLNRYLIARWEPGNARARIRIADESIALGSRLDDPLDLFHGLHWRAAAEVEACELEAAHRSMSEEARIAARLGDPTANWLSACSQSLLHSLQGRLDEAEAAAERAAELGRESDQPDTLPFFASQIASIRWQQGRLSELSPLLDAALENHPGLPGFRSLVALARLEAQNPDGAREALAVDSEEGFRTLPRDPTWFAGAVTYAHVAAELEDRAAAEALFELLHPLLGRIATTSVSCWGLTDHAVGRLAATLGEEAIASDLLGRSLHEYRRLAMPVWRGHAALDLAKALPGLQEEPAGRARELVAEARAIGERHGAGLLTRDASFPASEQADPTLSRSVSVQLEDLDLTERQRDVVALIARGKSNVEIAEELTISPSTVKRHAENAFARAGVRGRKGLLALLYEES